METRRLILALVAGFAVFFAYTLVYNSLFPAPKPPQTAQPPGGPSAAPSTQPGPQPVTTAPTTGQAQPPVITSAPAGSGEILAFTNGESTETLIVGTDQDDLKLQLTPRGAAVTNIWLTERKDGEYTYRLEPDSDEPYDLLTPVADGGRRYHSYQTTKLLIEEFDNHAWRLDDVIWQLAEKGPRKATFVAPLRSVDDGETLLRVVKTYELRAEPKLLNLTLSVENLGDQRLSVALVQDGPVGIGKEHLQYEMRSLVWAQRDGGVVEVESKRRGDLAKRPPDDALPLTVTAQGAYFLWTALANKYFGVFTRPLPISGDAADYIQHVVALAALPGATTDPGDMLARFTTAHMPIDPGEQASFTFEVYAGPKDDNVLEKSNPAFTDKALLGYSGARKADLRCMCCVIPGTPDLMKGLLDAIQYVVRNYGVAIMILVLIVRTLLHPLAVYQQKSMYRMQEVQARLQPKMQALRERHANDKARLNQEMMKLYADEGANPMGMMVSMLPMLIQMPILIALWVGINTDIHLRHAPFDGFWIDDLSAPDALISFGGNGLTIPILGWLPLVGRMFTNIPSINLLPILMGISMWLQQKYMPKPAQAVRLEEARKQQQQNPKKGKAGMTPQDQLRQQQMIAYMMSIMFPLMFYYMPSGLNLYWMSTNVFGIFESLIIRKQLREEKQRRDREGPKPPKKKTGPITRILKRIAEQAEQLQRKADAVSDPTKKKRP